MFTRDQLLRLCSESLFGHGFARRDRLFLRDGQEQGIVQVVGLEMGKGAVAGLFRINIGIWISEARFARAGEVSSRISDIGCQVRIPLPILVGLERWGWPTDENTALVREALHSGLEAGLRFLDSHNSRATLLNEDWNRLGPRIFGLDPISRAAILAKIGNTHEAIVALRLEFNARSSASKHSQQLVLAAAERIGIKGIN